MSTATPTLPKEVEKDKSRARRFVQIAMTMVWTIGSLFLGAGRLDWIRGWICVALWLVSVTAVAFFTRRYNPQLMKERAKWKRKDTKPFDKVFLRIVMPLILLQPALGGMDAVRFHWSSLPFAYAYVGAVLYCLSMALVGWVLCMNPFAETSVRIQHDRGHRVITSGPYRFVRHPMYVGMCVLYVSTGLVLGSLWALADAVLLSLMFIARTALEDQTLRRELAGYEEYAAQTKYRLLPGVW